MEAQHPTSKEVALQGQIIYGDDKQKLTIFKMDFRDKAHALAALLHF